MRVLNGNAQLANRQSAGRCEDRAARKSISGRLRRDVAVDWIGDRDFGRRRRRFVDVGRRVDGRRQQLADRTTSVGRLALRIVVADR